MATHPREWNFGKNTYRLEQPELLWVTFRGVDSLGEVRQSVELYRELGTVCPFYMLADMDEAEGMEPEARHYIIERMRPEWLLGFIYIRPRLIHRAIARGLLLGYEMTQLEKHPLAEKMHFVPTPAQARTLYARLRMQRGLEEYSPEVMSTGVESLPDAR